MHPIFLRNTSKHVTKPTDKAKAAIDEQLEISSKKRKNDNTRTHAPPKKVKSTQGSGTEDVPQEPPGRMDEQAPARVPKAATNRRAVVRSEEEEEALTRDSVFEVLSDDEREASSGGTITSNDAEETATDELGKEKLSLLYVTATNVCWGDSDEVLKAADDVKNAKEVRMKIVTSVLCNGSITASFEHKGKGRYGNLGACAKSSDPRGFQQFYNQPKNSPSNAREISLSLGAL
ncbi:hypothetical protein M405DRAFT_846327 [Rhizopogon salebrosus TDB-379]|nr:hypothetical protein M405DRAFT_846327 [Rhizopogon salebrosus TDB-379]